MRRFVPLVFAVLTVSTLTLGCTVAALPTPTPEPRPTPTFVPVPPTPTPVLTATPVPPTPTLIPPLPTTVPWVSYREPTGLFTITYPPDWRQYLAVSEPYVRQFFWGSESVGETVLVNVYLKRTGGSFDVEEYHAKQIRAAVEPLPEEAGKLIPRCPYFAVLSDQRGSWQGVPSYTTTYLAEILELQYLKSGERQYACNGRKSVSTIRSFEKGDALFSIKWSRNADAPQDSINTLERVVSLMRFAATKSE